MNKLNVGIIGAGLIGKKRGLAALVDGDTNIEWIADINIEAANKLSSELHAHHVTTDWAEVVRSHGVDAIIVTTPNYLHAPVSIAAAECKKHVLCEKPLTISIDDAEKMILSANKGGIVLKTGFNHRHFPHIWKAKEICDEGILGKLYYIRCHYGHGGRKGYDEEWRGDVKLSGGGELMDQGVHIVDLGCWFLGNLTQVQGMVRGYHWGNQSLEDNSFFTMSTDDGKILYSHVSWTQWKNDFSFEIFGEKGYAKLSGLTGYYGAPKLVLGLKTNRSVVPEESVFEFPSEDISFLNEWREFKNAIIEGRRVLADGKDGLEVLKLVMAVYGSNNNVKRINL